MTKTTLTALGAALIALGQELQSEGGGEAAAPAETPATPRRGRAAKAEPTPTETPAAGKPESELRELIRPLVEDGRGEEVKKLIVKHGGTKLSDLPPAAHAAFTRDIEGLTI